MRVIEIGDELSNDIGQVYIADQIVEGRCGLLVVGHFKATGNICYNFHPPELEPGEAIVVGWEGWYDKGWSVLSNGTRIGSLSLFERGDPRLGSIEEYDAAWDATDRRRRASPKWVGGSRPWQGESPA